MSSRRRHRHARLVAGGTLAALAAVTLGQGASAASPSSKLIGYATLPATTFAAGPPSGAAITPNVNNGITSPFASQPVQGFSAIADNHDGTFDVMPDNGYGAKGNSADFYLRRYTVRPHFETGTTALPPSLLSGAGNIDVLSFIEFRDPDHKVPFTIVNDATTDRLLTGADFDIESMQEVSDGSIWIGDEFGPYLLHFDATGKLLDAPIALPDFSTVNPSDELKSPSNPTLAGGVARVPGSGGFEGMALSSDGTKLYPLLERPLDNVGTNLLIHEFDLATKTYTGVQYVYPLTAGTNIGDFVMSDATTGLVIERDNGQGTAAAAKKIFKITLPAVGAGSNVVTKSEFVDLLAIDDPDGISLPGLSGDYGLGTTFKFPFVTIEDVVIIDANTIGVLNDNNFPFSKGRHLGGAGAADDNEFIILHLDSAPPVDVPEAPVTVLLSLSAALLGGGVVMAMRRRAAHSAA